MKLEIRKREGLLATFVDATTTQKTSFNPLWNTKRLLLKDIYSRSIPEMDGVAPGASAIHRYTNKQTRKHSALADKS